jgi:hypothetical protein
MLERRAAVNEIAGVARAAAETCAPDDEACAALGERLPADQSLVAEATHDLGAGRASYLDDRAYRLLSAAAVSEPVRPIDPHVRELFEAERELGRSSLTEAFERLVALEPRLRKEAFAIWESREQWTRAAREGRRAPRQPRRPTLTGIDAEGADPLLHTDLASTVAHEYAIATRGGERADEDPTPFFERQRRRGAWRDGYSNHARPRVCG